MRLAPLVPVTVSKTQAGPPRPPLAPIRSLVMVLSHLELLLWRELLCCRRVTRKAATRQRPAQRTHQNFGVLSLLVDLTHSSNPSSVMGHSKWNLNDLHRGCHDLTALRSEAELLFSPWEVDNYLIVV